MTLTTFIKRLLRLAGCAAGVYFAAVLIAFPMPKADCPPTGEGRNMCVMQKQYLRAGSALAIGGCAGMAVVTLLMAMPGIATSERRRRPRFNGAKLASDPIMTGVTWGRISLDELNAGQFVGAPARAASLRRPDPAKLSKPLKTPPPYTAAEKLPAARPVADVLASAARRPATPAAPRTAAAQPAAPFTADIERLKHGGTRPAPAADLRSVAAERAAATARDPRRTAPESRSFVERRYPRVNRPVAAMVKIPRIGPFGVRATALDVSAGGAKLDGLAYVKEGDQLLVTLALPDEPTPFEANARVAWTMPGGTVGIEFLAVSVAERARLIAYAESTLVAR